MHMAEMPTVSDVHKAASLAGSTQGHVNSDGTTLNKKKNCWFIYNGVIMGVQEVADAHQRP